MNAMIQGIRDIFKNVLYLHQLKNFILGEKVQLARRTAAHADPPVLRTRVNSTSYITLMLL